MVSHIQPGISIIRVIDLFNNVILKLTMFCFMQLELWDGYACYIEAVEFDEKVGE